MKPCFSSIGLVVVGLENVAGRPHRSTTTQQRPSPILDSPPAPDLPLPAYLLTAPPAPGLAAARRWRLGTTSRRPRRSGGPSSPRSSSASSDSRTPSCLEQGSTTSSTVVGCTTVLAVERPFTNPPPSLTPAVAGQPSSKDFQELYSGRLTLMVGG